MFDIVGVYLSGAKEDMSVSVAAHDSDHGRAQGGLVSFLWKDRLDANAVKAQYALACSEPHTTRFVLVDIIDGCLSDRC